MLKVTNTEVFGWEAAIRGMRNPLLGFGPDLFPEYENKCMYNGLRPMACIGPGCQKNGDGNPMHCPYWIEDKED